MSYFLFLSFIAWDVRFKECVSELDVNVSTLPIQILACWLSVQLVIAHNAILYSWRAVFIWKFTSNRCIWVRRILEVTLDLLHPKMLVYQKRMKTLLLDMIFVILGFFYYQIIGLTVLPNLETFLGCFLNSVLCTPKCECMHPKMLVMFGSNFLKPCFRWEPITWWSTSDPPTVNKNTHFTWVNFLFLSFMAWNVRFEMLIFSFLQAAC